MAMKKIGNLLEGEWKTGSGEGIPLTHAITGKAIGLADSEGLPLDRAYIYAREVGGPALRKMTFQERGRVLKRLALFLQERKEDFYKVSWATGATRADSWIDIEGGIGNLFANASLRRKLPDTPFATDGDFVPLGRQGSFGGHHLLVPKQGVAVHINAFNFPVWGMLEKVAVNWMAGVPAIVKPATVTSFLTESVVAAIHESGILPPGALQLVCGSARNILDFVDERDVVTFTGSAHTGRLLKSHPRLSAHSVPFNMEADSLNSAVLGPDAGPGSPEFDLFIKEVRKEMTVKCGQKCTAVRRIFVPRQHMDAVQEALTAQLSQTIIGDPQLEGVRMGALVGKSQCQDVLDQVAHIEREAQMVFGAKTPPALRGAEADQGAFLQPMLFRSDQPHEAMAVHDVEAFGPVSTMMPYDAVDEAVERRVVRGVRGAREVAHLEVDTHHALRRVDDLAHVGKADRLRRPRVRALATHVAVLEIGVLEAEVDALANARHRWRREGRRRHRGWRRPRRRQSRQRREGRREGRTNGRERWWCARDRAGRARLGWCARRDRRTCRGLSRTRSTCACSTRRCGTGNSPRGRR